MLGVLESQGVSKGAKPIHHLILNYTNSKDKYGLGMGISKVIKIYSVSPFPNQEGGWFKDNTWIEFILYFHSYDVSFQT